MLQLLGEGKHVALVTDAGTPGISDPGTALVALARERLGDQARIETIPGPSALSAALAIAGVPTDEFVFLGFLPHKKGRQTLFEEIAESERTVIFYESPHRIEKALASLAAALPEGRRVLVFRELTKIHEALVEVYRLCGYDLLEVPRESLESRADFILAEAARLLDGARGNDHHPHSAS